MASRALELPGSLACQASHSDAAALTDCDTCFDIAQTNAARDFLLTVSKRGLIKQRACHKQRQQNNQLRARGAATALQSSMSRSVRS